MIKNPYDINNAIDICHSINKRKKRKAIRNARGKGI